MTAEANKLMNDPSFVLEFAVGDPFPELFPQERSSGIHFAGVYFSEPHRFVLKSAHLSRDDNRIFDHATGRLVYNSHHPGKNPYAAFDPLGLTNQDDAYQRQSMGAEWESLTDATGHGHGFPSFKIRAKPLSRHGRQYIKRDDGEIVMNVGKVGKLKSMSFRPHFAVGKGDDENPVYTVVGDMMGRSMQFTNERDELVAVMALTSKAMIMNAALGAGSESTIDVAPGVDCSMILAAVLGLQQVGEHFLKDAFNSYVLDPVKDQVVGDAVEAAGAEGLVGAYAEAANDARRKGLELQRLADFMKRNFFS